MTDKMLYATAWALVFVVWVLLGMVFSRQTARSFFLKTLWGINFAFGFIIYVLGIMPHAGPVGSVLVFFSMTVSFLLQMHIFRKDREREETEKQQGEAIRITGL